MASKRIATQISDDQQPMAYPTLQFLNYGGGDSQQAVFQAPPAGYSQGSQNFPPLANHTDSGNTYAATPSTPAAKRTKKGGRLSGSQNFKDTDKRRALAIIRQVRPFGSNMWEQVAIQYSKQAQEYDRKERDGDFLKKFFMDKVKEGKSKPTGCPDMPWDVKEVREIWADIEGSIHMSVLDDPVPGSPTVWDEAKEDDEDEEDEEDTAGKTHGNPASQSMASGKMTMSIQRSSRPNNQGLASKASEFLDKIITGFDGPGTVDPSLGRAQAQYDKLEQRYEKLEEKMDKMGEMNGRLQDENKELERVQNGLQREIDGWQRENQHLKMKIQVLEAELGKAVEGGYTGVFTETLKII
ncbi:hypothetical protein BZA77DRAFT_149294 [Pyronema omphalodes]|nr:hypothetical protein BZA77DRAFT_149294 [Pyronema omphalodes]